MKSIKKIDKMEDVTNKKAGEMFTYCDRCKKVSSADELNFIEDAKEILCNECAKILAL